MRNISFPLRTRVIFATIPEFRAPLRTFKTASLPPFPAFKKLDAITSAIGWELDKCDEAVQEMTIASKNYVASIDNGKNPDGFISILANRCAQAVLNGRKAAGGFNCDDVSDPAYQRKHSLKFIHETEDGLSPLDSVSDSKQSTSADCAAFRVDTESWLERMTKKKRAIVEDMMTGEDGFTLAKKHKVTPGRISQIRRECKEELVGR